MKVKELIEKLENFQSKLDEHQKLYSNSFPKYTGGMYPDKNKELLKQQCHWLNRFWGEYHSVINKFRDFPTVQESSTGDEWDYIHSGLGLSDIAPFKHQSLEKLIDEVNRVIGKLKGMSPNKVVDTQPVNSEELEEDPSMNLWNEIKKDYDVTKYAFSKKISFVNNDQFKKKIIFRDVAHAYYLSENSLYKPAVILAGGVIEELLRLYLKYKNINPIRNTFEGYINTCETKGLLKKGISRLSDSVRDFRNIVHLEKEKEKRYTISKAAAKGAISAIFTIANDF